MHKIINGEMVSVDKWKLVLQKAYLREWYIHYKGELINAYNGGKYNVLSNNGEFEKK